MAPLTAQPRHALRLSFCVLTTVVLTACAAKSATPGGHYKDSELRIQVSNRHWQEVKVYLLFGSEFNRRRLGTIDGSSTGHLLIPRNYGGQMARLLIQPTGDPYHAFTTQEFFVAPHVEIELHVESDVNRSRVYVR